MITKFHAETSAEVQSILNSLNVSKERVRLVYGDVKTGLSWNESCDTIGTISNSTGPQKIAILTATARSHGGGAILDNCILAIRAVKRGRERWLYKSANYTPSVIKAEGLTVTIDGVIWVNCKTEREAANLAAFMRLERNKR